MPIGGLLVDFCFRGCDGRSIVVNNLQAHWDCLDGRKTPKCPSYSQNSVKLAISYLVDNSFFKVGKDVFQQVIGIPMGTDPAPFMANLFLYYYERNYINELKKTNVDDARLFCNVFRFIDDLCAINDGGLFDKHHKSIYPPEMELKKENVAFNEASFLDLDISIQDKQFSSKLFDKRDAFPFAIVRMPYLSSNIPSSIFYATISSELLRIAICSTGSVGFISSAKALMNRMIDQGAKNKPRLLKSLRRLYGNHTEHLVKFFDTPDLFTSSIFP